MLEVKNLGISFGGLRAVDDFNLSIEQGQLYGLIGPNGAGKTTIFNMLTGVYKPTDGKIFLDGEDITGKSTIEINKEGIARTFQNIRLFSDLSVLDNVKAGLHNQKEYEYSTLTGILRLPRYHEAEKAMRYLNWMERLIIKHPTFPMVNRESWRSPEHWQPIQNFCFWMSQQPV